MTHGGVWRRRFATEHHFPPPHFFMLSACRVELGEGVMSLRGDIYIYIFFYPKIEIQPFTTHYFVDAGSGDARITFPTLI